MCMLLSLSPTYGREYFIKSSDAKWYQVIAIKLMALLELPKLIMQNLIGPDTNFIAGKKASQPFSGQLEIASSKVIDFRILKALSKTMKVTINDIVTCALSCSMNTLFKENKDPNTHFKIVIPANIRFSFYPTRDEVKLENKFAPIPLTVPLVSDMQSSYEIIKKVTAPLRNSIS